MIRRFAVYPVLMIVSLATVAGVWAILSQRQAVADPPPAAQAPIVASPSSTPVAPAPSPAIAPAALIDSGINLRRTVTVQVVQKTKDAVVNISARKLVDQPVTVTGPFMQQIDTGQVIRVPANSLGSGFIIHRDGYVVTNNHVVDRAREISVELADGRKLPADLISADPDADLAILRIHSTKPLPTLELGESNDLMIGEPVIAVGNPLGYSHSVSTGIVSALHRDIDPNQPAGENELPAHGEDAALKDLVQTDAAINRGNSGGPLLNAYGQVIGINTAIRSDAQNIGFAIPIDRLRDLIPELMNPSQVIKVDVPLKLTEKRTITEPATVQAAIVTTGTNPLTLDSINGQHPTDIIDTYAMLLNLKPNQALNITWAGDRKETLRTKPTPMPDAIVQARQRFGLTLVQVTPMLADKYHLALEDGLFVKAVDRDSAGEKAGISDGDVIVQMGRVRVLSLDDLGALLPRLPDSGAIRVWVVRGSTVEPEVLRF
jgi:serine protease Do